MKKYKLVYFGSSHHSLPALQALYNNPLYEVVAVVSQPDKPVGRKQELTSTPVSMWAQEHTIEMINAKSWKKTDEAVGENAAVHRIKELQPDFGVLVYYGRILPQTVIDAFPKGIVNTHPSLLPKYRGPTPGQMVIMNGETESGVSIMLLVAEQDAGPILAQEKFSVDLNEIPETYYQKGFKLGAELMLKVLPDYLEGRLAPWEQDHSQATSTPLLSRDNGKIDWTKSGEEIERMVRAFTPWPGTWTEVWVSNDGKILFEEPMRERLGLPKYEGEWDGVTRKRFIVHSALLEGSQLVLDDVQLEGKNKIKFGQLHI
jgi:methionyl-tRNA formyltransferase